MLVFTEAQKQHIAAMIRRKREELFGYPGGNRALAERVGVSPQLVSMWACNKRMPGHTELLLLAEAFELTLNELCRLNKRPKKSGKRTTNSTGTLQNEEEIRDSMLTICAITDQIVKKQKLMLTGKRNYKKHNDWLRRISKCVDTI